MWNLTTPASFRLSDQRPYQFKEIQSDNETESQI